ncbi:FAD-dependent monooxygenase [Sphingomonas sp. ID0503]|uniref:FAD-dependent monooxygenase n=1 Tax=Sphingomonas sp. ID0503 TaxID=3399691 RepID=UPI003AFAC9FC
MGNILETPVFIAGGGPVGMTLALNLARYGVRSILAERNPTTTRHPKMDLTNARSMELFKRLGLTEQLRDAGVPRENRFDILWITTLAGHELHRFVYPSASEKTEIIRRENDGHHASEAPLRVSQVQIEPVLKKAIDDNPLIDVRFGTKFERIVSQDTDGVTLEISDSATGETETVRCQYLAGCDGGGSRVRRALGIELDGDMAVAGAHMVHFRTHARDVLQRWGPVYHLQSDRGTIIAQNDHDIYTLQAWLIPGLGVEDMRPEDVLEGWVGQKFDYEILQANPWTANFVVAQRYRAGRALLAGDSAHQYIPTGGYGMNSGIADAAALSWVLAANVLGWGGNKLLDGYEAERLPTAWWHLEASRRHMGVRLQIGEVYAQAGDLLGEGPEADARRAEAGRKIEALGNAENESWGVEFGYRYDKSPVICAEANPPEIDPLTYHPTTWPGARLPHIFLEDGVSIHDKLGLWFTLVVIDDADTAAIESAAQALGVPLDVLRLGRPDLRDLYERNLILVRPDQHVAWRGDALPDDIDGLLKHVTGR